MAETPLTIGSRKPEPTDDPAGRFGRGVAGMVRYMMGVLDREDRLESGVGDWLSGIADDRHALERSVRSSALRALHLASESGNFAVLQALAVTGHETPATLEFETELDRPALAERLADLTSAGLVTKSPEAGQVSITEAGEALIEWVERAVQAGAGDLKGDVR